MVGVCGGIIPIYREEQKPPTEPLTRLLWNPPQITLSEVYQIHFEGLDKTHENYYIYSDYFHIQSANHLTLLFWEHHNLLHY